MPARQAAEPACPCSSLTHYLFKLCCFSPAAASTAPCHCQRAPGAAGGAQGAERHGRERAKLEKGQKGSSNLAFIEVWARGALEQPAL